MSLFFLKANQSKTDEKIATQSKKVADYLQQRYGYQDKTAFIKLGWVNDDFVNTKLTVKIAFKNVIGEFPTSEQ